MSARKKETFATVSLEVDDEKASHIRAAAKAQGKTVSEFVVDAACAQARLTLSRVYGLRMDEWPLDVR